MSQKVIVFDCEILNQDPASMCAIGLVEMRGKEIVSRYYSLIKPENLNFDPYRFKVHKITKKELLKEKPFDQVWQEIKHYFEDAIVVSHDIQGDMLALRKVMDAYHIPYPHVYMSCTHVLSHALYPELTKYNLPSLCEMIGYEYKCHHALEDAVACAELLIHLLDKCHCSNILQLHEQLDLEFGEVKENYYRNIISPDSVITLSHMTNRKGTPLYHKTVCFTGDLSYSKELLKEKTMNASAIATHQVSTQTDLLVVGKKGYHKVRFGKRNKKVLKALSLIKQGQDLRIIHENEYIQLLNDK